MFFRTFIGISVNLSLRIQLKVFETKSLEHSSAYEIQTIHTRPSAEYDIWNFAVLLMLCSSSKFNENHRSLQFY